MFSRLYDWFRGRTPGEQVAIVGAAALVAGAGGSEVEPDHGGDVPADTGYDGSSFDVGSVGDAGFGGGFDAGGGGF